MRTGHCLCGGCRLEADADPVVVAHCYCTDCQRLTGAGHSTGAMFPEPAVRLTGPVSSFELVSEAGNRVTRLFCSVCGSPLAGRNSGMPGFVTLSAGVLDSPQDLAPQVAIFTRSRRPWDPLAPDVAAFEAQPAWSPGDGV